MNVPKNLLYAKSHEWVQFLENGNALVGITDYAQESLSDVVFANLCDEGDTIEQESVIGDVESIKAVSEIFCPVGGTVEKVNQDVLDSPESLNNAPYESWLVELSNVTGKEDLLTPEQYEALLQEEA